MFENNYDYSAIIFDEGNYITIEFAGILKNSKNNKLSNEFLNFMLSSEFQSVIPQTNIMYPVINNKNILPDAYKNIIIPKKSLQINPELFDKNKEFWIEEWLNAM